MPGSAGRPTEAPDIIVHCIRTPAPNGLGDQLWMVYVGDEPHIETANWDHALALVRQLTGRVRRRVWLAVGEGLNFSMTRVNLGTSD